MGTIREMIEQMERETLSCYATLNENSKGRAKDEPQCDIRPLFREIGIESYTVRRFVDLKIKRKYFLLLRVITTGRDYLTH